MDAIEQSSVLYDSARELIDTGDLSGGLALLQQSLAQCAHFKTLELIGEVHCRLGRHHEAIIPLAAATGLNRGSRAPCLLAEAFLALGQWSDAEAAASEALRRTPGYRRAQAALDTAKREGAAHTSDHDGESPGG